MPVSTEDPFQHFVGRNRASSKDTVILVYTPKSGVKLGYTGSKKQ